MFKIGDRIIATSTHYGCVSKGYKGTVVNVLRGHFVIEYDKFVDGHNGDAGHFSVASGKIGHCWNYNIIYIGDMLRLCNNKSKKYR